MSEIRISESNPDIESILDTDTRFECVAGELRWRYIRYRGYRGLGDVVKRVTVFLNIKQCGGCLKRQNWLNELFPF